MSMLLRASAVAAAGALLTLAACTSLPDDESAPVSPAPATSPSPSPQGRVGTTDAVDAPAAPGRRDCYELGFEELAELSSDTDPTSCRGAHNAQTIHVGEIDAADGHSVDLGSVEIREQLSKACRPKLASYLGGDRYTRALSRFQVVWFSPTREQADAGARWFRCDVIAFEGHESLMNLPPPARLTGVLDAADALDTYGLCGTAAPGAPGFARVICAQSHSWRAVSTISIDGGRRYPGARAVRAGDETCRNRVRAFSGSSLKFRYGWEWPTRDQWQNGQHFGYCWAPD